LQTEVSPKSVSFAGRWRWIPLLFLGETEEFLVKEAKKSWWTRIKGKEANGTEKIRTCDLSHQLNVLAGIGEQIRTCDLSHQLSASALKQKWHKIISCILIVPILV